MTTELAALASEVAVLTIEHMANEAGLSFDETIRSIAAGGNAAKRFLSYIATAQQAMVS